MNCRVCQQEIHTRGGADADHHLHVWPMDPSMCAGCGMFAVDMQLFMIRACGRSIIGDWETGWMKEIIARPAKYRDMEGD